MGDNCTSKEDSQLTPPQEELARSSKVEPRRKPYHMDEGKDANALCKESSLQSDDLGSDTDEPDQTDSENEMNSKESSFLGSSSDTDDPDETDSEEEMNSKKSSFLGCSSVMSDKDQMQTSPKEKINPSLIKVQSRKCRCLRSMMQKLGLRHSKTFSVRSETSTVHVKEKACGTSDDIVPNIDIMEDGKTENELSPETNEYLEDHDLCEEHPQASEEGSKPSLVSVQSRRHRYIVAILRKLGIRCSVTSTINERSETMLQKTCGTNDDIDDMEEHKNEDDFVMSDKDQMKTPPKEKINPSLIKVQSRKCRCLRSMMQKLGLRHSKTFSVRSETSTVHVKEKACGTSDDIVPNIDIMEDGKTENELSPETNEYLEDHDLCEEHPQASEEGSKPSLVSVQSRRHRYIVAILRKLGIRCSVTSTINERSETMLQKTCGTNDDIDDKEEHKNEDDFVMSDKDQMKTPPKEKINPSLIKVQSRKCRCLRSMMQKLGLRHSKTFSVRSETSTVHVKEKACGTSDDIVPNIDIMEDGKTENELSPETNEYLEDHDLCEEHPQASEEGSKPSLVSVQSRRHRYIVAILRKLGIRCSVTSTINERSETMLQKTCGTNDDIDDMEEHKNEDDFVMSDKDQMKTPPKEKINPSLIKVQSRKCRCLRSMMQKLGLRHSKTFSVRSETSTVHVKEKACGTSDDIVPNIDIMEDGKTENELSPETNEYLEDHDLCEEHPQASEEGSKPSLVSVQSRRHRYIVAILRKLGIRCSVTSTINERSETMLQKTCGTNDDIDDKEEHKNEDDFVMSDKDQMKTPPKEKINPSLIKVQSRKCRCLRSMMQKLGLRHSKTFSVRSETSTVHVKEKACGTSDDIVPNIDIMEDGKTENELSPETNEYLEDHDLCEEHPQASEEGSKPSLVSVQSRRHRYIVAILRKLGIRCSVTSTINERSETMLQKTCGTNDDIDDKEEHKNEDDFVMSDKDQMKTPPKEKINPSLIKVQSKKCRCLRSMMQKLGLRHSKTFSVRSETSTVHVKEKACGTSDDIDDMEEDSNEDDFDIDDMEEDNNEDDFDPAELETASVGPPRAAWEE
ncbi:uncharacterized protein LOC143274227 [Peromyscus maniculatus bairdii]|uniref:uncharacterized protein LOC143274227 n=1 Tax=Peromyscus maniculatus bairdii TaxID=230844 RepID=UPI003FD284AF